MSELTQNKLEDVLLNELCIEPRAVKSGPHEAFLEYDTKVKMSYHQSLARLQEAGYERHLRPAEYVRIYLDYLEKITQAVTPAVIDFHQDLFKVDSEFLSAALETTACDKDTVVLTLYMDPQGLSFPSAWGWYQKSEDFTYAYAKEFIFDRRILTSYLPRPEIVINPRFTEPIPLEKFPDAFVKELYNRSLADLTAFKTEKDILLNILPSNLSLCLPTEGIIHPIVSGTFPNNLGFMCYGDAASRGMRTVVRSQTNTAA